MRREKTMNDNTTGDATTGKKPVAVTLFITNTDNGHAAHPCYTFGSQAEADAFTTRAEAKGFRTLPGRHTTTVDEAIRHACTIGSTYWN